MSQRFASLPFMSRLFNVRVDEGRGVFFLYAMFLLFGLGTAWAETIIESSFYLEVGVGQLSVVLTANALLSIAVTAAYTAFVDRMPNDALLVAILVGSLLLIAGGLVLIGQNRLGLAYLILYVLVRVVRSAFMLHWWTYVDGFYDTRSLKRLVPILSSASRLAIIIGGLTMPLLNRLLSPSGIVATWMGTLAIVAAVAWLRRQVTEARLPAERVAKQAPPVVRREVGRQEHVSYLRSIEEGFRYSAGSPYLRWMALSILSMVVVFAFLNYQGGVILKAQFGSGAAMSNFIGLVNGVGSLLMLPVQLFVISRVVNRVGVGGSNLIFPLGTFAIAGVMIGYPSALFSAVLANFDRNTFRYGVQESTSNLLYNAVPLRIKGRARAFSNGFVLPVGLLLGSALLSLMPLIPAPWTLPILLGLPAALFVISGLVIRNQYAKAMLAMLEQEDFSALAQPDHFSPALTDPATLDLLRKRLAQSANPEFTIFMAKLIGEAPESKAAPILAEAAQAANGWVRAAILDVLVAVEARGAVVRNLYSAMLTDEDGRVRLSALAGIEQIHGQENHRFLANAAALLADPDLEVRVRALAILLRSHNPAQRATADMALRLMLAANEGIQRTRAVYLLGQRGGIQALPNLLPFLTDPEDAVRLEAALAIEALAKPGLAVETANALLAPARLLVRDPIERARVAGVSLLSRMAAAGAHEALVNALTDASPLVRDEAVAALVRKGRAVMPVVQASLATAAPQVRKMAAVVLVKIDPPTYDTLVRGTEITNNLLAIYDNLGLIDALGCNTSYPSIAILSSTLREQNQSLLDEIFFLLSAVESPDTIRTIVESLRSADPRLRANAAEALESLTTPQIANLILPLFNPEESPVDLLALGRQVWGLPEPDTQDALRRLVVEPVDLWLRVIAVSVLAEIQAEGAAASAGRAGGPLFEAAELDALLKAARVDRASEYGDAGSSTLVAGNLAGGVMLSIVEKVIFLKGVPFFEGMTIDQLKVLASVCEEELFTEGTRIFNEGDPGGALYVVVNGRVGIEQEKRKGVSARLAVIPAHSYFGEMNLFDNSPRSAAAIALQDTVALRLRSEPLIALVRRHPDLSLVLINVLSKRLREESDRVAELTRGWPRELHKLYDALEG